MKLAISNIAWQEQHDTEIYDMMKKYGYDGLEIAPTRIFPENPYDNLEEVKKWSNVLYKKYGFCVPSMQSIWFGRQEKIFGSEEERNALLEYTKKAIDFAEAAGCRNLVFGCPRNRFLPDGVDADIAIPFFKELGEYAVSRGTVIGMEANPPIYNTNYVNDTTTALKLICGVNSEGFKLNLDFGTMIQNEEEVTELEGYIPFINHVHISEPGLKVIEKREMHQRLAEILKNGGYQNYVSIEMGKQEELSAIESAMVYVREVFG